MTCRPIAVDCIKIPPFIRDNWGVDHYRIWIGRRMAKRVGVRFKDIFEWF